MNFKSKFFFVGIIFILTFSFCGVANAQETTEAIYYYTKTIDLGPYEFHTPFLKSKNWGKYKLENSPKLSGLSLEAQVELFRLADSNDDFIRFTITPKASTRCEHDVKRHKGPFIESFQIDLKPEVSAKPFLYLDEQWPNTQQDNYTVTGSKSTGFSFSGGPQVGISGGKPELGIGLTFGFSSQTTRGVEYELEDIRMDDTTSMFNGRWTYRIEATFDNKDKAHTLKNYNGIPKTLLNKNHAMVIPKPAMGNFAGVLEPSTAVYRLKKNSTKKKFRFDIRGALRICYAHMAKNSTKKYIFMSEGFVEKMIDVNFAELIDISTYSEKRRKRLKNRIKKAVKRAIVQAPNNGGVEKNCLIHYCNNKKFRDKNKIFKFRELNDKVNKHFPEPTDIW